ncbi:MAG: ketoacyl-ACP synthase III [Legionellales bacterium]|nr:ketoacyl-ACP synthase III [Legionellales bacterium]
MIYIHGIGHFHPENIIDNSFLENLDIGTNHQWIMERVGIETRRTVLPLEYIKLTKNQRPEEALEAALYTNAQTAVFSVKKALEQAKINKSDIRLILSGSCTPASTCPPEACMIACALEIECPSFDLNSACSTIAAQLNFINMMIPEMLPDYILIVTPENNTRFIDYSDRSSAVLWGDCSTAMIVSTKIPSKMCITHTHFSSSPSSFHKVKFPIMKHFVQEGRTVQTFAIKKSNALIKHFRGLIPEDDIEKTYFIGHQANYLMLSSICNMSRISNERHLFNVDQFGNCGAAGAMSVLSMNQDKLRPKDRLILAVVGAGLAWGGLIIEVTK